MHLKWLITLLTFFLGACIGINPNSSPTETFIIPIAYETVFERAKTQAQRCWSAEGEFPIIGALNAADRTAFVAVTGELGGNRYGQVDIKAENSQSTHVRVTVNGINIWSIKSIAAMQEVLQFGTPTCTSYMPKPQ